MSEPVHVAASDPAWPREFERLARRACAALGHRVVQVDHVGSTAVPGLAAKPIVDLDVVLRSAAEMPAAIAALAGLGYVHEGDLGVPGREAFAWPVGEPRHHLYVVVSGNEEHRRHLLLRDYLRAHPDAARHYGAVKRRLADLHSDDRDAYSRAKSRTIEQLLALAQRDAAAG